MPLEAGRRLGPYEVTAKLGEGGMGEVWRARDTRLDRDVALKVLPEAFTGEPERLARFEREAKLLASLNHPNIGAIHGLEEEGGVKALVLELVEGPTLAERMAEGPIPLDEALIISRQIAEALEAAHQRGVIHRDLKPSNVKLTPEGTVKVLDFGLAKAWEQPAGGDMTHSPTLTAQMTQAGVILGTASYMSPEQARGRSADKRADIWAFGVVLWEMLAGRKLFEGETVSDVLAAVLRAEPPWADLPPSVPRGVRRLLDRCLAKDPDERLHDIADARIELDEVLAESPSAAVRAVDEERQHRSWLRSAAVILAVAVLAAAGSLYLDRRLGRQEGATSPVPHLKLDIHLGPDIWWIPKGSTAPSYLALSPDGHHVAFSAFGEAGGLEPSLRLHVRSLDELEARPLQGTEGAGCPFFSPDGSRIGFEADDRLKVVARDGGGVRTLCAVRNMRGATWSPTGLIFFATGAGDLLKIPAEGGEPEVVYSPEPNSGIFLPRWPVLLPGNRYLLFTSLSPEIGYQTRWALHALSLESGEPHLVLENAGAARFLPPDRLIFVRGGLDYDMAGNLHVVGIDPRTAELTGQPREILQGVHLGDDAATPYFDLSREGALLYSPTDPSLPERQIVWVDRTGTVTPAYPHRSAFSNLHLSPDGTRVVVSDGGDIWVLDLGRDTSRRITSAGNADLPIWTPDGPRLIFQVTDPDEGLLLYEANPRGGEGHPLSSQRAEFPNFVSPDGSRVNFSRQLTSAQWDLAELSLEESGTVEPWLATEEIEINAQLSPDGRWVAYRLGGSIAVRPYPGPGVATIVASGGGHGRPIWGPEGRELFFHSRGQMMAAPVSSGEAFSAGVPEALFEVPDEMLHTWRSYDVAPDGERFLMLMGDPKEVEPLRLVYVPNWMRDIGLGTATREHPSD